MSHEIEVKLRLSVDELRNSGIDLAEVTPRHFEDNWLLAPAASAPTSTRSILRVRKANGRGLLTYKEEPGSEAPESAFKLRTEIETGIDDVPSTLEVFARLGYRIWFRYQKYRTIYKASLPSGAVLEVMADETPLGDFVELEGGEEAIAEAVRIAGVSPADYILESYLALQTEHCRRLGRDLEDMLFGDLI